MSAVEEKKPGLALPLYANRGFATRAIHAGQPPEPITGAVYVRLLCHTWFPVHLPDNAAQLCPDQPWNYVRADFPRCSSGPVHVFALPMNWMMNLFCVYTATI